ncbi:hypothetical protein [Borreliella bavariensis]|uniref:hypothetical protein n=1 Tax=Borreliella bavariensis TaxID=664662 RepID=UPI001F27C613|nr:hypothetical protein [Borreliella bavariensis]
MTYRKGRAIRIKEIKYLEKVIKIIHYTIRVQKEIDSIISNLKEFNGNIEKEKPTLKSA